MDSETGFLANMLLRVRLAFRTSHLRNSFFLLVRSTMNYFLGFLFWLVVARSYPAAAVGVAAALLTTLLFVARGSALGLPSGLLRFLPAASDRNGLLNAAFTVSGLVSFGTGLLFVAGLQLWAPALALPQSDIVLMLTLLVSAIFFTVDGVLDNAFVAARHADYGLIRTAIFYGLRLPLAFLFALWGLFGIVFSWTLSLVVSVVGTALLLPRFFPGYRPRLTLRPFHRTGILSFSLWNYGTSVAAAASSSLLPLLIIIQLGADAGAETSAYFYAAYTIATLLYNVPHSFSTSLLVEGSYIDVDYRLERRKTVRYSGPLLALGIAGAILLGRPILGLFGEGYAAESYETLVLLALASPILLVTGIFSADLQVGKRAKPIFFVTLFSALATLIVSYATLSVVGILGVAAGVVAGQASKLTLYFLIRQRGLRRAARARPS